MFVQIAGSLCVLLPFVLVQTGVWSPASRRHGWLNLLGSAVLAAEAALGRDWGFLLLESVWAVVSLRSVLRRGHGGGASTGVSHGRSRGQAARSATASTEMTA